MQQFIYTIFTWLKTTATINHLCKMTAAAIQGGLIFEGGAYCNVIIIGAAAIQKPSKVCSAKGSTCYITT